MLFSSPAAGRDAVGSSEMYRKDLIEIDREVNDVDSTPKGTSVARGREFRAGLMKIKEARGSAELPVRNIILDRWTELEDLPGTVATSPTLASNRGALVPYLQNNLLWTNLPKTQRALRAWETELSRELQETNTR